MSYVELHAHSAFSFLDGASSPDELALRAAELGYRELALTDHDGIWGSMEFACACHAQGIRPITGAEVTVVEAAAVVAPGFRGNCPPGAFHLTLLVADAAGYRNLCRLLTDGPLPDPRGEPSRCRRSSRSPTSSATPGGSSACPDAPATAPWRGGSPAAKRRRRAPRPDGCSRRSAAIASASSCRCRSGAATGPATAGSPASPRRSGFPAWRPGTSTPTIAAGSRSRTRCVAVRLGGDPGVDRARAARQRRARPWSPRRERRSASASIPRRSPRPPASPTGSAST